MNINTKDKRILAELDMNARQPISHIAKNVGVSKEVAIYRIKRMENLGLIQGYYSVINYYKLGYFYCRIFIRFHNITIQKEKEIIDYLINEKKIGWISTDSGEYDLGFAVCKKNIIEFEEVYNELNYKYGNYIQKEYVTIGTRIYHFPHKFIHNQNDPFVKVIGYEKEIIEIDTLDKKILKIMSNNPRISYVELSKKLKKSVKTIVRKVQKLENNNILVMYRPNIYLWKLGYQYHKVFFIIKNMSNKRFNEFISFCQNHKNILYITKAIGFAEVEIELVSKTNNELYDTIKEIRSKFGDFIKDYQYHQIIKNHSVNYLPIS